jgi:hypothetical protein
MFQRLFSLTRRLVTTTKLLLLALWLIISLALIKQSGGVEATPLAPIRLTSGTYTPVEANILGKSVLKLHGVPYAHLRSSFQAPDSGQSKKNLKNEQQQQPWPPFMCIQPMIFQNSLYGNFKLPHDFDMTVNCLTMNLYMPGNSKPSKLLPAMLFIHGGSNAAGAATFFDPSVLAVEGNVIVAMPNYRLDVLGFLNKQSIFNRPRREQKFAGNYGLKDQIAALKWLHANCESLGCDKNEITVFGHSAGSSDAMLLAQSPLARPFIKRVIMQSGSSLAHWAFLYERHVYDKIREESRGSRHTSNSLIKLLNLSKSKYVSSMNDTLKNFLVFTSCDKTRKVECFTSRLRDFYLVLDENNTDSSYPIFREIFDRFDLDEIVSFFGYFHKTSMDSMDMQSFVSTFDDSNLSPVVSERTFNIPVKREDMIELLSVRERKNKKVSTEFDQVNFISFFGKIFTSILSFFFSSKLRV